jgi:hypothetical protein
MKKLLSFFNSHSNPGLKYFQPGSYYEVILEEYLNVEKYIEISNQVSHMESIDTNVDIQPALLGTGTKEIISIKGTPSHVLKEKNIVIYVYKWRLNGINSRCTVHFYNDKAFLVKYHYDSLKLNDKKFVTNAIAQKYLNQNDSGDKIINTKIIDKSNNMIFIDKVLEGYKVSYLGNQQADWYKNMLIEETYTKKRQSLETRSQQKQFFAVI